MTISAPPQLPATEVPIAPAISGEASRVRRWVAGARQIPVAVGLVALLVGAGALSQSTSALLTASTILTLVLLGVAVGLYEHRVGSPRAATALGLTYLAGSAGSGVLLSHPGSGTWLATDLRSLLVGPALSVAAVGVLAAGTALLGPQWRRRVRILGAVFLAVMVVRSGQVGDVQRALAFGAGLAIGPRLAGRSAQLFTPALPDALALRGLAGAVLAATAVSELVRWVSAAAGGGLLGDVGPAPSTWTALRLLVTVVATILLADALRRDRAAAFWLSAAGLSAVLVGAATGAVSVSPVDVSLAAVVLMLLLISARSTPLRVSLAATVTLVRRLALTVLAVGAVTVGTLFLLQTQTLPTIDAGTVGAELGARLTLGTGPFTGQMSTALTLISLAWVLTALAIIAGWLYRLDAGALRDDPVAARALLVRHGGGSLGWQRTWPGLRSWVSPDAQVTVAYRVELGVAIALGDPVGPQSAWPAAIEQFERYVRAAGLTPAWYAVTDSFALARSGGSLVQIGEDTTIDLPGLQLKGRAWQDVRTARNRATRDGITLQSLQLAGAPASIRAQVESISRHWVEAKPLPEMGFTLGGISEALDQQIRTHLAVDRDGTVHGITTWMPIHRDGQIIGWTLDLMRRRADGFRPVMEFLIAESALLFQAEGYQTMSMSVAPLARRNRPANGALDSLLERASTLLEPAYGFRSLLDFKAKFQPTFHPVHLGYRSALDLPEISAAIGHAYLPAVSLSDTVNLVRQLVPSDRRWSPARALPGVLPQRLRRRVLR